MSKILCEFNNVRLMCQVTENMGYQGGEYVKAVSYNGVEEIVIKRGGIWVPKPISEKLDFSNILGQNE